MAPSTGRHDADESASDRARIDYLAGEPGGELDPIERAELDELRALLADPTLWSEPPAGLADSVVGADRRRIRPARPGTSSAVTDLDPSGTTGNAPETVVGGAAAEAADPVEDDAATAGRPRRHARPGRRASAQGRARRAGGGSPGRSS